MSVEDQPSPKPERADKPAVWDLVIEDVRKKRNVGDSASSSANRHRLIEDMRARDLVGRERYGTPLQTDNGRDAIVDAYQESLDLAVYLRQAIAENGGSYSVRHCYEQALEICFSLRLYLTRRDEPV